LLAPLLPLPPLTVATLVLLLLHVMGWLLPGVTAALHVIAPPGSGVGLRRLSRPLSQNPFYSVGNSILFPS
jgi:hypothetical protein